MRRRFNQRPPRLFNTEAAGKLKDDPWKRYPLSKASKEAQKFIKQKWSTRTARLFAVQAYLHIKKKFKEKKLWDVHGWRADELDLYSDLQCTDDWLEARKDSLGTSVKSEAMFNDILQELIRIGEVSETEMKPKSEAHRHHHCRQQRGILLGEVAMPRWSNRTSKSTQRFISQTWKTESERLVAVLAALMIARDFKKKQPWNLKDYLEVVEREYHEDLCGASRERTKKEFPKTKAERQNIFYAVLENLLKRGEVSEQGNKKKKESYLPGSRHQWFRFLAEKSNKNKHAETEKAFDKTFKKPEYRDVADAALDAFVKNGWMTGGSDKDFSKATKSSPVDKKTKKKIYMAVFKYMSDHPYWREEMSKNSGVSFEVVPTKTSKIGHDYRGGTAAIVTTKEGTTAMRNRFNNYSPYSRHRAARKALYLGLR